MPYSRGGGGSSGSSSSNSSSNFHSPVCRPIQRFVEMETENTELAQSILKPSLNTPIAASTFTLIAGLRAVVYNVLPSKNHLPSPSGGRLFALLTGFISLSVVLLRLHIVMYPGSLRLWQWKWMSSPPLLMLSVVLLVLSSLLLIFPWRLEESLKRRRRRTRSKSVNMVPLRIQQSAPVALQRDVAHPPSSLQSHVHAQWTRVRQWAEQTPQASMLCNRSSAAATFIIAEMQEQLSSPRLQLEFRDLYACTFIAESRLLFRVSRDGVVVEIKRLPMSQPAVLVQSFVNRCWQLNDGSQCFEIVGRVFEESGMVVYSYSSYRNLFGTLNQSIRPVIRELLAKLNGRCSPAELDVSGKPFIPLLVPRIVLNTASVRQIYPQTWGWFSSTYCQPPVPSLKRSPPVTTRIQKRIICRNYEPHLH